MSEQNTISPLLEEGVICVQGADARTFLQGQLTCDMTQVTPEHSQLAAYCNRQGRMLAIMRLVCLTDDSQSQTYLLRTAKVLIEPVIETLKRFGVFSKVTFDDCSHTWHLIGVNIKDHATELAITLPDTINDCLQTANYCVTCVDVNKAQARYEVLYTDKNSPPIDALFQQVAIKPASYWYYHDIIAGIGRIKTATFEKFTPHQVNLQCLNAISFAKGCYLGQEVIARMHHLGKLKQHMYYASVQVNDDHIPTAGDTIVATDEDHKSVGSIVDAQVLEQTCHLLISLNDRYCDHPIAPQSMPDALLTLHDLPYQW